MRLDSFRLAPCGYCTSGHWRQQGWFYRISGLVCEAYQGRRLRPGGALWQAYSIADLRWPRKWYR